MPGIPKHDSAAVGRPKPHGWRRLARVFLRLLLLAIVSAACFIGALFWKHESIVGAGPGTLKTPVQPGQAGRHVNPFIRTGGFPWVCGNNFPGAMVPFGMLRLGPETASLLLHDRALNTSGYYYGDEQLLGFSHTRLNGTGATDGGHFLVIPTVEPLTAGSWQPGKSPPSPTAPKPPRRVTTP
jgi:putative alpha-1,2-mannosidase